MTPINGVPTWWDVHGQGAPVVLLHPGGADSRAYDANLEGLAAVHRVHRFDRRAQGRSADPGGPITFAQMTDDAIAFLETVVQEPAFLVGHSIGAPLVLLIARRRPDLVRGFVFSEGVFAVDGWKPGVLDPLPDDAHAYLEALHGEVSPDGPGHWADLWPRLDAEHQREPSLSTADLAGITPPALLMFADTDGEVRVEHLHAMHEALPDAQLAIVPGTGHGLLADKPDLCNRMILDFLAEVGART